jgi:hypothetical protein
VYREEYGENEYGGLPVVIKLLVQQGYSTADNFRASVFCHGFGVLQSRAGSMPIGDQITDKTPM